MFRSKFRWLLFWIGIAYVAIIASVLYPAVHEGFGLRLSLWNCVLPIIGLILVLTAMGRSKSHIAASVSFAVVTAIAALFFFAVWFFTPLDTDPHSITTKLVFVFGPLFSLALAVVASVIGWFAGKIRA
jgi:thiol:disulfide interchange protein